LVTLRIGRLRGRSDRGRSFTPRSTDDDVAAAGAGKIIMINKLNGKIETETSWQMDFALIARRALGSIDHLATLRTPLIASALTIHAHIITHRITYPVMGLRLREIPSRHGAYIIPIKLKKKYKIANQKRNWKKIMMKGAKFRVFENL